MTHEKQLKALGITLPPPPRPAGLYVPAVQSGDLLFVSGQLPITGGRLTARGYLGEQFTVDQGAEMARRCALNALAAVRGHLGTLDRVSRVVKVTGYVASSPGFNQQPQVINGASQLLVQIFGEAGRHARAAVGLAELPLGAAVEVEFVFEVAPERPAKAPNVTAKKPSDTGKAKPRKK